MSGLPAFPAREAPAWAVMPDLSTAGASLRPARDADLPALRAIYAATREAELALVPWPPGLKQAFCDQQFELQHRHYLQHYAEADFLMIERDGAPIGRLYLRRTPPEHLVVDISLLASARGAGLGTTLLKAVLADAAALGRGVGLHVRHDNPAARRLYLRLGFVPVEGGTDTHQRMRWTPPAS